MMNRVSIRKRGHQGGRHWLLLFFFSLLCTGVGAQERKLQYRPYADLRNFHYGFYLGLHQQSLQLPGLVGEWRLSSAWAFRLLPTMHFATKHLVFRDQVSGQKQYQDVKSTYISLPMNIKLTPPRINNYRPYFIAGINPMYDLTVKDQENILLKPFNMFLEFGFGCDRYLPFFKFIPEIKFCFGLADILDKDRSSLRDKSKEVFTRSVTKGKTNMIVLSFYFE